MKKINLLKVLAFSSLLLVGCSGNNSSTPTTSGGGASSIGGTSSTGSTFVKGDKFTRYTESWRSVKTEGWGIVSSVKNDEQKLEAALKLFDYMYSDAGNELMSYGPSEYGYLKMNGNEVATIDYQGKQVPELSEGTLNQLSTLASNNYTNYYRYYVGATLPVGYVKEQGMEYQCTHQAGKDGLEKINKNIELGTFEHPSVGNSSGTTTSTTVERMASKTNLSLSILYKEKESEPKFVSGGKIGNDGYTDPNGNLYSVGDWKPTWKALQERLNLNFSNTVSGKDVAANYTASKTSNFSGIDIITGKASDFAKDGPASFLNLMDYLDRMPNFKNFLENNPIVKTTVTTADANSDDAIYYAPYFDGFNDIERMTLIREDMLVKLLDDDTVTYDEGVVLETKYNSTIEKKNYQVEVAESLTSDKTKTIEKKQSEKNIIDIQNALPVKNGKTLTEALKQYIKDVYGDTYSKPSDLFNGVDAAYDADEFIALLRCAKTNPTLLTGDASKNVVPFYPRANTNDRVSDIYRWAGHLWGVQGVESRSGFLFVSDDDGIPVIKDARGQLKTAQMLERLHQIYEEGLILPEFEDKTATGGTTGAYNTDLGSQNRGFATYDYCQTQTALNYKGYADNNYKLTPIVGAFTNWTDLTYTLCPTTFKLTTEQSNKLTTDFANLETITVEKNKQNLWTKYVMAGFGGTYGSGDTAETLSATPEAFIALMKEWNIEQLENLYSVAYLTML